MDGPWFIYDHYLTVKEWSPNFHPASDTIKEVAVWLRISGLPIEYYDSRALKFIGNRIGKTVKVDKNTLSLERGKYARLCVQVNLSQPLLAMFTIKGRKYNIEYEGLHMLCTICGRYGHYKEGCPDKAKVSEEHGNEKVGEATGKEANRNLAGSSVEGPWRVVQKTRRNKKANPGKIGERETNNAPPAAAIIAQPEKINFHANSTGSRFNSLLEDTAELEKESMDKVENVRVVEVEGEENQGTNQREHAVEFSKIKNKRVNRGGVINRGDGVADRIPKESKLATRGGSFKGKSSTHGKRGVDNIMDRVGVQLLENTLGQSKQANFNPSISMGSNNLEFGKKISYPYIYLFIPTYFKIFSFYPYLTLIYIVFLFYCFNYLFFLPQHLSFYPIGKLYTQKYFSSRVLFFQYVQSVLVNGVFVPMLL
jgi:hypothetical protein